MRRNGLKGLFGRFLNVSDWLGTAEIKKNSGNIKSMIDSIFTIAKPESKDSFEGAVAKYELDEAAIEQKKQYFFTAAMVYLALFFAFICYFAYLVYSKNFMTSVTTLCISLIPLALFFKSHFWYTQIKYRRLGFTFSEWLASLIVRHK